MAQERRHIKEATPFVKAFNLQLVFYRVPAKRKRDGGTLRF
jgi:hypothetical protein